MKRSLLFPVIALLSITGCISLPMISGSGQSAAGNGNAPELQPHGCKTVT